MNGLVKYSSSFSFATESNDDLVQEAAQVFEKRIKTFNPRTIKRTSDKIFYTAGVLRLVWNTNLLYGISEGEIRIAKEEQTLLIHFVIKFHELLALSVVPIFGAFVIMDSIPEKGIAFLLVVCITYAANVLMTILRYRRFVKRTMEDWLAEKRQVPISEVQKQWMRDTNKCDACGYSISVMDLVCPDCGLRLQ